MEDDADQEQYGMMLGNRESTAEDYHDPYGIMQVATESDDDI